jgi:hypothetical protein
MVILFSVPSHGRHQMGANSGVQWDTLILLIVMTHCCLHSRYRNRQGRYL